MAGLARNRRQVSSGLGGRFNPESVAGFGRIFHYAHPPKNLFFFDECPGIQLLKRLLPDLTTDKTNTRLEEFEYIRNGTTNILAFFNYHTGKVLAECTPDHTTATFIEVFTRHAASCPDQEPLHYVMDNLSTHRGYPFCKTVAALSNVPCPSQKELLTLKDRVAWLTSEDKRIVIHFTPYHGSWLNLVEFWFGIMNKKVLHESYGSEKELMESFESFLHNWNTLFAHPFRWTYDGKGLHIKAVARFTTLIKKSADTLEISSLTKQLQLMCNLLEQYDTKIPTPLWETLNDALRKQKSILKVLILHEESTKKRAKADTALNSLVFALEKRFSSEKMKSA